MPAVNNTDEYVTIYRLDSATTVNSIELHCHDYPLTPSFKYYIEVSEKDYKWHRVIDRTEYICRAMQFLYFPARTVERIRLVITHTEYETVKDCNNIFNFPHNPYSIYNFSTGTLFTGILFAQYPRTRKLQGLHNASTKCSYFKGRSCCFER